MYTIVKSLQRTGGIYRERERERVRVITSFAAISGLIRYIQLESQLGDLKC